jgi:glycosyltransferase involved in cell wall biosynthesis
MAEEAPVRRVSAIVPAYNEAARITPVLDVLVSYPGFAEVLVVDDGSTDATGQVAAARGARVIRNSRKSGKGSAMQRGVDAAGGSLVFFCDADIQGLTHEIIDEILDPVRRGDTEMFIGMIDRRIYDAPFIIRFVPLLGGIRALTRELWERTPPRFKKGFEIETALNYYADHPGRPQHKVFPGLSQTVKEKKYGLLRGTYWRWKMVLDILATNWALHTGGPAAAVPEAQRDF